MAADTPRLSLPEPIRRMERELTALPACYARTGDVVLTDWRADYAALVREFGDGRPLVPAPWGWDRCVKTKFSEIGVPASLMPSDAQLAAWRAWASRAFGTRHLHALIARADGEGWGGRLVGREARFCEHAGDVAPWGGEPRIFKLPWTSSGRGHCVSTALDAPTAARIATMLRRQGGVAMDRYYDRALDFALEYEVREGGRAAFLGYSVFHTGENGKYGYNLVESQERLRDRIVGAMAGDGGSDGGASLLLLRRIADCHRQLLEASLGGSYRGPVGVDLFVANCAGRRMVHPCVELNLRMNMGIVALRLHRRLQGGAGGGPGLDALLAASQCRLSSPSLPATEGRAWRVQLDAGKLALRFC